MTQVILAIPSRIAERHLEKTLRGEVQLHGFLSLGRTFRTRQPSYRCMLGKHRKNEQKQGLKDDDRYLQVGDGGRSLLLDAGFPAAPIGAGDFDRPGRRHGKLKISRRHDHCTPAVDYIL